KNVDLIVLVVEPRLAADGASTIAEHDIEHRRVAVGWAMFEIEEHRLIQQQAGLLVRLAQLAFARRLAELQVADRQMPDTRSRVVLSTCASASFDEPGWPSSRPITAGTLRQSGG